MTKMNWTRRRFLAAASAGGLGCAQQGAEPAAMSTQMGLEEFQPTSALVVSRTPITRAKFPAIDVHTHLRFSAGLGKATGTASDQLEQVAAWMDQMNIETMVNLTGGWGEELQESLAMLEAERFAVCTEPAWTRVADTDYPTWQADELQRARDAGAVGVKILKTLGLFLREEGALVAVDDARFDPMWEAAGELNLPVFIHTADPDAFFTPTDRFNERWEELGNHPDWSFHGGDFPSKEELREARNRVIERHPKTKFVCLHVGNRSENLAEVGEWLDRYPNMSVEIGARLGELGRQPRTSRKFFEAYQDRILFGTDAVPLPEGAKYPQQTLEPAMFEGYFRFLETEDEYFDYSTAATPPQGRWKIYGIGLPEEILAKVYRENALRVLDLG